MTRGAVSARLAWPLGAVCAVLCGCSSDRDWAALGEPNNYPHRASLEGVTVAAEAWTRDEDLRTLFDKLPGKDVLALRLVIFNRSSRSLQFSCTQAKLVLPDGTELRPMPASDVMKRLEANEAAAAAVIYVATLGYGAAISAAVAAGEGEKNWKRLRATKKCTMELVTLDPNEALSGFVFYESPPPGRDWEKAYRQVELRIARMPRTGALPLAFAMNVLLSAGPGKESE